MQWCTVKNLRGYTLETLKARGSRRRGGKVLGEGVSPPQPTRGLGERRELPQRGANAFYAYFRASEAF